MAEVGWQGGEGGIGSGCCSRKCFDMPFLTLFMTMDAGGKLCISTPGHRHWRY